MKFLIFATVLCAICAWFFAFLALDSWRDGKKFLGVVFAIVSFLMGLGGVMIWILL